MFLLVDWREHRHIRCDFLGIGVDLDVHVDYPQGNTGHNDMALEALSDLSRWRDYPNVEVNHRQASLP